MTLISTTQYNVLSFTAVSYGSPSTYGPEFSENPYYADILGSVNNYLFEEDTSEFERDILKIVSYDVQDLMSYYYLSKEQQDRIRGAKGFLNTQEINLCPI